MPEIPAGEEAHLLATDDEISSSSIVRILSDLGPGPGAGWSGRSIHVGLPALVRLVLGLVQGPRLNWFKSPMITLMIGGGAGLMVLFMINEWFHPLPFFKLQLLANRNL